MLITPARDVTQQVPSRRIGSRPVSRQAADSIKRIKAPGARARTKGFYFASFLLFWPATRSIALDSPGAKKKAKKGQWRTTRQRSGSKGNDGGRRRRRRWTFNHEIEVRSGTHARLDGLDRSRVHHREEEERGLCSSRSSSFVRNFHT